MLNALALISVLIVVVTGQAVTDSIAPDAPAPSGCSASYDGTFGFYIEVLSATYVV